MRHTIRFTALAAATLFLAACLAPADNNRPPVSPTPNPDILAVARNVLTNIQPRSIRENREYCGSIVQRADGSLYATKPEKGGADWCQISFFDEVPTYRPGDREVADYHTHSAYSPDADSEVPSPTDMSNNGEEGIPGYVSTPGGRLWFIRADGRLTYQICGVGCLPQDPNFVPETGVWTVPNSLTFQQLNNRGE